MTPQTLLAISALFWGAPGIHTDAPVEGPVCQSQRTLTITNNLPPMMVGIAGTCDIRVRPTGFLGNEYQCEVAVHEYGHTLGYGHTKTRGDIMYDDLLPRVPLCESRLKGAKQHTTTTYRKGTSWTARSRSSTTH